jgi:putative flippase GtrA
MGFTLQVVLTELLTTVGRWPLALSTLVAVEGALLHNFAWHERWTWRDAVAMKGRLNRCVAFHAANGLTSIVGNIVIGKLLADILGLGVLPRTSIAVALVGLFNFFLADRLVFGPLPATDLIHSCSPGDRAATAGVHSGRQKDSRRDGGQDLRLLQTGRLGGSCRTAVRPAESAFPGPRFHGRGRDWHRHPLG